MFNNCFNQFQIMINKSFRMNKQRTSYPNYIETQPSRSNTCNTKCRYAMYKTSTNKKTTLQSSAATYTSKPSMYTIL